MKDNYSTLLDRITSTNTIEGLERIEKSATRVYNAGCLTVSEFGRLDVKIMEKMERLSR